MPHTRWAWILRWYLPLAALVIFALAFAREWRVEQIRRAVDAVQQSVVEEQVRLIRNKLDYAVVDALNFAQQNELAAYLDTGDQALLASIAGEYRVMMEHSDFYDEIQLLDASGMELVRVSDDRDRPRIARAEQRADQSALPDLRSAVDLHAGEVYLSPMELDADDGRLARPFRPTLRIAAPVLDPQGIKRGLVLLSYSAQRLLDRLRELDQVASGQTMLLNCDGYWLLAPTDEMAWGFQIPAHAHQRMQERYPDVWRALTARESGSQRTAAGAFYFRAVTPLAGPRRILSEPCRPAAGDATPMHWLLVSFLDEARFTHLTAGLDAFVLGAGAVMLVLLALGVSAAAVVSGGRRERNRLLERMARTDALTGLANRRSFEEHVDREVERARRHRRGFAIALLDLDGFKAINDTQGHGAGDLVLQHVAAVLTQGLRAQSDDLAGRLGGDELAILLGEARDEQAVVRILDKVRARIRETAWQGQHVSASIGVAVYPEDGDCLQALLRKADEAMYASKAAGKDRVTLASSLGAASIPVAGAPTSERDAGAGCRP